METTIHPARATDAAECAALYTPPLLISPTTAICSSLALPASVIRARKSRDFRHAVRALGNGQQ